jgi:hypothetical protein
MPKRESQTQFAARHARYQLATSLLEYIEDSRWPTAAKLVRVQAMLKRVVERDGQGF